MDDVEKARERHREHTFAKDFVFCVMRYRRPDWEAEDIFPECAPDSPFTCAMRSKIWKQAFEHQETLAECSERLRPDKVIDDESLEVAGHEVMNDYLNHTVMPYFNPEQFYKFCLRISKLADEAISFDLFDAPRIAVDIICKAIEELKLKQAFNQNSLDILHAYCGDLPYL